MESTGCKGCDKEQEITGDRTAMCIPCQIDAKEFIIAEAMNDIEELKWLITKPFEEIEKEQENGDNSVSL